MRESAKKIRDFAVFAVLALAAIEILRRLLGSDTVCIWSNLWGVPCPGCGLGRAGEALRRGDFAGVLRYHALLPVLLLFFILWGVDKVKPFLPGWWRKYAVLAVLILFLGYYVVRMAMCFPQGPEPMTYNRHNICYQIYQIMGGRHGGDQHSNQGTQ